MENPPPLSATIIKWNRGLTATMTNEKAQDTICTRYFRAAGTIAKCGVGL